MPDDSAETADGPIESVLVVGATGNQGGVTVEHLLAADQSFTVRGLTRRADGEAARALADRGVDVRAGDLNDPETLHDPVAGVDAVVIITNIWTAGFDGAVRQAKHVADVALQEGVQHVVFSGAGYHDRELGIDALEPGGEVEAYLRSLEMPATFLRPVWFMHNLEPAIGDIQDGTLALPIDVDVPLQMLAVEDVGRAITAVLSDPGEFAGVGLDLAGDELTLAEMAETLSAVMGTAVHPYSIPLADAREELGPEMGELFGWFNEGGYAVDIPALEDRLGFELTDFPTYLAANGWAQKESPDRLPGLVKAMRQAEAEGPS